MRIPLLAIAGSFVLMAACSSAPTPAAGAPRPDRDILTAEQLGGYTYTTVYDAVAALRMNWLKARGADSFSSPSAVVVYLDNVKLGGVETLRSIQIPAIQLIRHYDPSQANARWGLGHGAGAIQVITQASSRSPSS